MPARIIKDVGVLKYNVGAGEGEVELSEEFSEMHSAMQMDVLLDWIADLEELVTDLKEGESAMG